MGSSSVWRYSAPLKKCFYNIFAKETVVKLILVLKDQPIENQISKALY
jgi:hypothetical protein